MRRRLCVGLGGSSLPVLSRASCEVRWAPRQSPKAISRPGAGAMEEEHSREVRRHRQKICFLKQSLLGDHL